MSVEYELILIDKDIIEISKEIALISTSIGVLETSLHTIKSLAPDRFNNNKDYYDIPPKLFKSFLVKGLEEEIRGQKQKLNFLVSKFKK